MKKFAIFVFCDKLNEGMFLNILKAFLIGICASVPLGPVGIYVIQVSLGKGHKPGFITALGATTVDTIYSIVAIFALAIAESFIETNKTVILIAGGLIIALLGAATIFKDPFRKLNTDQTPKYSVKDYVRSVLMGFSNPAAIFVMLALFAFFGIRIEEHDFKIAPLILSLALGSAAYWFAFSGIFAHLRHNFKLGTLVWINRIAGIAIMIVGIALLSEGMMKCFLQ